MKPNIWKRIYNYEKVLITFFAINLVFTLVNEKANVIPFEISGYFFWLSIGLLLGFRLAKWEVIRVQKKQIKEVNKKEAF